MRPSGKPSIAHSDPAGEEMRNQEVLRANKELAAYFKGQRTEREARAALKTIKAFIRDRERADPEKRRPLPGAASRAAIRKVSKPNSPTTGKKVRRPKARPRVQHSRPKSAASPTGVAPVDQAMLPSADEGS